MELKEQTRIPIDHTKVIRLLGVKENGEEVYLSRHEGYVSLVVVVEENEEDN